MQLNSGQLASIIREKALNFWKKCVKTVVSKEVDTKYWDKRFSKTFECLSFNVYVAWSEIVEVFFRANFNM